MNLQCLLKSCGIYSSIEDEVKGITLDSREVKKGYIFVAIKGFHNDGLDFVNDALDSGAICIISDRNFNMKSNKIFEKVIVNNIYDFYSNLVLSFYDYPSKKLNLIGITGTNGKTTTTYILESIYREKGDKTGIIGTIENKINDETIESKNTTPEISSLQKILHAMVEKGVKTCFMEVSSHALMLDRVKGCDYDGAIFTNLTEDHLDFHITMENYFLAKKKLFENLKTGSTAIVNIDDKYSSRLLESIPKDVKIVKYSIKNKNLANAYAKNIKLDKKNLLNNFEIVFNEEEVVPVKTKLLGKHNVYNILGAASMAYSQNISPFLIQKGIENIEGVKGRFEFIREGQDFVVVIDYAHTDDALKRILKALKAFNMNRIITIFGCGGSRDRKKRPIMAEVASMYSDYIFITNDNPREENPKSIALDIEVGLKKMDYNNYTIQLDRREAIKEAINMARKGDIVLIAGKGHEDYQIFGQEKQHFSDKEEVIFVLKNLKFLKQEKELF